MTADEATGTGNEDLLQNILFLGTFACCRSAGNKTLNSTLSG
jgi:hypothetical protein